MVATAKLHIAAAERVLTTQVRVDEGRLRRRQADTIPRLLQILQAEDGARRQLGISLLVAQAVQG